MYVFFDTETTGLPLNYKAPVTDVTNWPRVMQLGHPFSTLRGDEGLQVVGAVDDSHAHKFKHGDRCK